MDGGGPRYIRNNVAAPWSTLIDDGPRGDDEDDLQNPAGLGFETGLRGLVRDAWGAPIEGVSVSTNHGFSGLTDRDGRFAFAADARDQAVVAFTKDGYARSHLPFGILEGTENAIFQTMAEVDVLKSFDRLGRDGAGRQRDLPLRRGDLRHERGPARHL